MDIDLDDLANQIEAQAAELMSSEDADVVSPVAVTAQSPNLQQASLDALNTLDDALDILKITAESLTLQGQVNFEGGGISSEFDLDKEVVPEAAFAVEQDIDYGFGQTASSGPPSQVLHQQAAQEKKEVGWLLDSEVTWFEYELDRYVTTNARDYWIVPSKKRKNCDIKLVTGYQKESLPMGIHMLAQREDTLAIECFDCILKATGDMKVAKKEEADAAMIRLMDIGCQNEDVRDEIYLQLMKQTTRNTTKDILMKCWDLMLFCCSLFSATPKFIFYLRRYLKESSEPENNEKTKNTDDVNKIAKACSDRLQRAYKNGSRKSYCSADEREAIKNSIPLRVHVELLSGVRKTLFADSATLASELQKQLEEKLDMEWKEGFGIYAEYDGEYYDALADDNHVADFITKYEMRENDKQRDCVNNKKNYEKGSYRFVFMRKFLPEKERTDCENTNLLLLKQYIPQYLNGMHDVEAADVPVFAGLIWATEYPEMSRTQVPSMISKLVPLWAVAFFNENEMWSTFTEFKERPLKETREALLRQCMKWPFYGASIFKVTQQYSFTMPSVLNVYVNSIGIHFVTLPEDGKKPKRLRSFEYRRLNYDAWEYKQPKMILEYDNKGKDEKVDIETENDDMLEILNIYSKRILDLSSHCKAKKQHKPDIPELLPFKTGDYIFILDKSYKEKGWYQGECNGKVGWFPCGYVAMLMDSPKREEETGGDDDQDGDDDSDQVAHHMLDHDMHFRDYVEFCVGNYQILNEAKSGEQSTVPFFTKTPPAISLFTYKTETYNKACVEIYEAVMTYMCDYVKGKEKKSEEELLNIICARPLKFAALRNEVLCQIMKQIAYNPSSKNTQKGWVLMALCLGCFPPTTQVLGIVKSFLMAYVGSPDKLSQMAELCYKQLFRTLKLGVRTETPTAFEIECVKTCRPIKLSVEMADGSRKGVFVDSCSTGVEMIMDIAGKVEVADHSNFGIVSVMSDGSQFCLVDDQKVMDVYAKAVQYEFNLTQRLAKDAKENPKDKEKQQIYKDRLVVELGEPHFKFRKIFFTDNEEFDAAQAKQNVLVYSQVQPDVRKGNYPAEFTDCTKMAALQYIEKYGRVANAEMESILQQFIPENQYKLQTPAWWKTGVMREIETFPEDFTADQARIAFLQYLKKWNTFGTEIFYVEQAHNKMLPKYLAVGINWDGIHLMNVNNKMILKTVPFRTLYDWEPHVGAFSINFGTKNDRQHFECTTTQGHTICELVSTYIRRLVYLKKKAEKRGERFDM